jgi:hypothetical protein
MIGQTQLLRDLQALVNNVDTNELPSQASGSETHRTQPHNQDGVIAGNANLFESLIGRSKATCDLSAVRVGKLVRQRHTILFFSKDIRADAFHFLSYLLKHLITWSTC